MVVLGKSVHSGCRVSRSCALVAPGVAARGAFDL
jgi:hypothetical protein